MIAVKDLKEKVANLEEKYESIAATLLLERLLLLLNEIVGNFNSNERNKVAHADSCKKALNKLSLEDQQRFFKELKTYLQTRSSDIPDIVEKVLLPETESDISDKATKLIAELEKLIM
jgi:phosphoenolpyruvate-protein kinase (PTS system EI component)